MVKQFLPCVITGGTLIHLRAPSNEAGTRYEHKALCGMRPTVAGPMCRRWRTPDSTETKYCRACENLAKAVTP